MKAGSERDLGHHDYIISLNDRLTESVRATYQHWDSVNGVMDGGLAGGELGVCCWYGKVVFTISSHLVKVRCGSLYIRVE